MKVQLKLWFEVPDLTTAQKLEDVIRNYAKNDIADVDGQPVEFLGSDVDED